MMMYKWVGIKKSPAKLIAEEKSIIDRNPYLLPQEAEPHPQVEKLALTQTSLG